MKNTAAIGRHNNPGKSELSRFAGQVFRFLHKTDFRRVIILDFE